VREWELLVIVVSIVLCLGTPQKKISGLDVVIVGV
jgi:hypothetical protein